VDVSLEPIRAKLAELRELAQKADVDIAREIEELERKLASPAEAPLNDAWRRVQLARHPERPTTLEYAKRIFDDFIELHGDRAFADDAAMVGGIGLLGGVPVTFFGNQKGKNMKDNLNRNFGMAHPEGYRKALRLAKQAEKFGRPVLTFIDSPGAHPGVSAEERGISQSIAANMKAFSVLRVPIIATILGEGCSGGAIGIGLADFVLMMENAYYTVITPEGCASILLRDAGKAPVSAALLKLTPEDMMEFRVVDRIIKEPEGGAQKNPEAAAASVKEAIQEGLAEFSKKTIETMIAERQEKFLRLGVFQEGEPQRKGFLKRLRDFF
jgi:acetyl-CoA carboxylase carboxyl transferase subunit alpha